MRVRETKDFYKSEIIIPNFPEKYQVQITSTFSFFFFLKFYYFKKYAKRSK